MDVLTAAFQLIHAYPGGAVALAPVLGKNPATLSHEVNPNYPTAKFGLDDAVKLSVWTCDRRIASAFASQVGCMLLPLPQGDETGTTLEDVAAMAREFADLAAEVSKAVADGKVSANELARVQREAAELVGRVETTVKHVAELAGAAAARTVIELNAIEA